MLLGGQTTVLFIFTETLLTMKPLLRNIAAVISGCAIGMTLMMLMHYLFFNLIPLPDGTSFNTPEQIAESVSKFELKHFINPFVAHSIGAFTGAIVAGLIAFDSRKKVTIAVGVLFLIAGIMNSFDIPAPLWYDILDLTVCYIPMAWLGLKVVEKIRKPARA